MSGPAVGREEGRHLPRPLGACPGTRGTPRGWRPGRGAMPWGQGLGWGECRVLICASTRQSEPLGVGPGRCVPTDCAGEAMRLGGACDALSGVPCGLAPRCWSGVGLLTRCQCNKERCPLPSCGLFVPGFPEASGLRPYSILEWEAEMEGLGAGAGRCGNGVPTLPAPRFLLVVFVFVGFPIVLGFGGARDETQALEPELHPRPPECVFF